MPMTGPVCEKRVRCGKYLQGIFLCLQVCSDFRIIVVVGMRSIPFRRRMKYKLRIVGRNGLIQRDGPGWNLFYL